MSEKEFIDYFVKKRIELEITQYELAKIINVSKSTLSRIENHKRRLNFDTIKAISIALNIDLNLIKNTSDFSFLRYD